MIAIIDYDAGNLNSVQKAFQFLGEEAVITRDPEVIRSASHVVLPGVGAFADAMDNLQRYELVDVVREAAFSGKPFLGICLGLQLLFDSSEESPGVKGLSILPGKILRIPDAEGLKIPHMGWNGIKTVNTNPLTKGIGDGSCFYFVHSYMGMCRKPSQLYAVTEYGEPVTAIVGEGNVYGTQFHPEKSGEAGLHLLKNFVSLA